jgi:hypothetical protein
VQVEVIHHNDVARGKTQDPITHAETPTARDGRVNLQSFVPVEPTHSQVRDRRKRVQSDGQREPRVESEAVVPALIDPLVIPERFEGTIADYIE